MRMTAVAASSVVELSSVVEPVETTRPNRRIPHA
jgi:hypothetical protein